MTGASVSHAVEPGRGHEDEERLMIAILDYLAEHPNAMDSMEGIADFWIARSAIRVELRRLKQVLTRLVESGVLERIESGSQTFFRIKGPARHGRKKAPN